jgi:murein DD-endopeptidase MepM/ murein hydrolase activator NlpD
MRATPRFTRRRALAAVGAVALVPLTRASGRASKPIDSAANLPFRATIPQLVVDGPQMEVRLSTASAYQGGAILVQVTNVGAGGWATVFGRRYRLERLGGALAGLVGFGVLDPPGRALLTVDVDGYTGEVERRTATVTVLKTQWTTDYIILPPPDPNGPPSPYKDEQPILDRLYLGLSPRRWEGQWIAPLPEPLAVSGYFGEQRSFNGGPVQGHHGGTDLAADAGTPVFATNGGTVVLSGRYLVRGNIVVVDHGAGVFSSYGHMESTAVAEGDGVAKGAVLGYVGTTGLSTGPHLHWEMAVAGILVDGLRWLDGTQGF